MKDKILTLIIGILIGAIITSICFIVYIKTNNKNKMPDLGNPPEMNQAQNQNGNTPPDKTAGEKPDGNGVKPNENSEKTNNNDSQNS